jgi:hypothetical protein
MQRLGNVQMVFGKNWKHDLKLYLLLLPLFLLLLFHFHLHGPGYFFDRTYLSKLLHNMPVMLWRSSVSNEKMLQGNVKLSAERAQLTTFGSSNVRHNC